MSAVDVVVRFFAAIEAGDVEQVRALYSPDALIWHNDDLIEQSVPDNLKVLAGLHKTVSGLRYDIIRRAEAQDGVIQQHVLRGTLPNGADVELTRPCTCASKTAGSRGSRNTWTQRTAPRSRTPAKQ